MNHLSAADHLRNSQISDLVSSQWTDLNPDILTNPHFTPLRSVLETVLSEVISNWGHCTQAVECDELSDPSFAWECALARWIYDIPESVIGNIRRFPTEHLRLLFVAANVTGWLDLAARSPSAAFAIAMCESFDDQPLETAIERMRVYVNQPRRKTWEAFGFEGSQSMTTFMEKLTPECRSHNYFHLIRRCWPRFAHLRKALSHETEIHSALLDLAVFPSLLSAFSPRWVNAYNAIRDVDPAWEMRDVADFFERGSRTISEENLLRFEAKVLRLKALRKAELKGYYPVPPIREMDGIEPIRSALELRWEAEEMDNCLCDIINKPWTGMYYFYRMLAPERASIGVLWDRSNQEWVLDEISTVGYRRPKNATLRIVHQWLINQSPAE